MKKKILKKKYGKKGLALSTLVGLIILILGFLIILFAYYQLNWTGNVDTQVCHQSVIYRATLPSFAGAKEYVPLKCKAQKICITSKSGGKCKEFSNSDSIEYIKVRDKTAVEQAVAREILSCWQMMGEGKLSLFSNWLAETYGISSVASTCVICSRIAYDREGLAKAGIDLSKVDVENYTLTHAPPGKKESYYVYMMGQGGKMSIQDNRRGTVELETTTDKLGVLEQVSVDIGDATNNQESLGKETAVMFMQVSSPSYGQVLKNSVLTLLGGTAGSFVVAGPKFASKAVVGAAKSPAFWAVLAIAGIYQYNSVADNQAFTAAHCGDIKVGDASSYGCSVVRTVNYEEESLSQYCSIIESIP